MYWRTTFFNTSFLSYAHLFISKEYCNSKSSVGKLRFGHLLLLISLITRYQSDSVESIFFGKTLGDVKVEKVIGDMCKVIYR